MNRPIAPSAGQDHDSISDEDSTEAGRQATPRARNRSHASRTRRTGPVPHPMPRSGPSPSNYTRPRVTRGRLAPLMLGAPPSVLSTAAANSAKHNTTNRQPVPPRVRRDQQLEHHLGDENLSRATRAHQRSGGVARQSRQEAGASSSRRESRQTSHGEPHRSRHGRGRRSASQRPRPTELAPRRVRQSRRSALSRPQSPVRVPPQASFLKSSHQQHPSNHHSGRCAPHVRFTAANTGVPAR